MQQGDGIKCEKERKITAFCLKNQNATKKHHIIIQTSRWWGGRGSDWILAWHQMNATWCWSNYMLYLVCFSLFWGFFFFFFFTFSGESASTLKSLFEWELMHQISGDWWAPHAVVWLPSPPEWKSVDHTLLSNPAEKARLWPHHHK